MPFHVFVVKMKEILKSDKLSIPDGIKVTCTARCVKVVGKRGELSKSFKHLSVVITVDEDERVVKIECWFANRKRRACVRSVKSAIENMFTGVTKGYEYHMRLAYAHFPINTHIPNDKSSIEIRNYIGERQIRRITMLPGVTIEKGKDVKDELILSGNDVDLVSLSAALIQQSCQAKKKDIRMFLDGIYVSERVFIEKET